MLSASLPRKPSFEPALPKGVRRTKFGTFEAIVTHKGLPGGRCQSNFKTLEEAIDYRTRVVSHLAVGTVPADISKLAFGQVTMKDLISNYKMEPTINVAKSDQQLLETLRNQVGQTTFNEINVRWALAWVQEDLKGTRRLAPGTIRKRVESLARVMEWWHAKNFEADPYTCPLRQLRDGYASYGVNDGPAELARVDEERDRRLEPGEEATIESVLQGGLAMGKTQPMRIKDGEHRLMLFRLLVRTGLRLQEAYRLRLRDLRFEFRTIHVAKSKTGAKREVPTTKELDALLKSYVAAHCKGKGADHIVFPWWNGSEDEKYLRNLSSEISSRMSGVFAYAGAENLRPHDLRHEATCRWMMMRDSKGRWMYRSQEVMRITGHKTEAMFQRYLSLRGSDLADRLLEDEEGQ